MHQEQHEAHDVLLCVGTGSNLDTPNRMRFEGTDFYLKTAAEMYRALPGPARGAAQHPARSPRWWTSSCPLGELRIPHFPVPDGETVESWLRKECEAGLVRRYGAITPELQERLDYELGVILSMGYAGYFLIVADFVALRPGAGDRDHLPGVRAGLHRHLHPGHHAGGPAPLRAARSSASSTRTA